MKDPNLICYGCAHSAGQELFPGKPSGERPCCFCVRNPSIKEDQKEFAVSTWYDGNAPVSLPMDCYQSVDMIKQIEAWNATKTGKQ